MGTLYKCCMRGSHLLQEKVCPRWSKLLFMGEHIWSSSAKKILCCSFRKLSSSELKTLSSTNFDPCFCFPFRIAPIIIKSSSLWYWITWSDSEHIPNLCNWDVSAPAELLALKSLPSPVTCNLASAACVAALLWRCASVCQSWPNGPQAKRFPVKMDWKTAIFGCSAVNLPGVETLRGNLVTSLQPRINLGKESVSLPS